MTTINFEVWGEVKVNQFELIDTFKIRAKDEYTAHDRAWVKGGDICKDQPWWRYRPVYNVYIAGTDELAMEKFEEEGE